MNLLLGLTGKQIGAIRHSSAYRTFGPGTIVFQEGDPAYGLYVIISGKIEIFRTTDKGETKLNELGPNDVFGEMGLIADGASRSATARAVEETLIFEMQNNPLQMFREMEEYGGGIVLLKNLICILGKWLRRKDKPDAVRVSGKSIVRVEEGYEDVDPLTATQRVRALLPTKGLFRKFPPQRELKPGEYLCRQGEKPDGFYFIHSGLLEVLSADEGGAERSLDFVGAPTVVGELGFFSGEPRSASLRAADPVVYTPFSGEDLKKLEKKSPEDALDLLFAAAQLIIHLISLREGGH